MQLRKRKDNRNKYIGIRVTELELNKIKLKAGLYCEGNISAWVATSALKYTPKKEDIKK